MRVRIVADDLTGATDSSAPFVQHGMPAIVTFGDPVPRRAPVVAISTNSRERDPQAASAAVECAARNLLSPIAAVSFKKMDSLLRGNLRSETTALLRAWRCTHVVVAPAFPSMGRTTVGGRQMLWGQPLNCGGPAAPATADLRAVFGTLPGVVCDAVTDEDLDEVVRRHWAGDVLWVGSAGLAAALARRLGSGRVRECAHPGPVRSILVAVGSRHPATLKQLAVLGAPDCGQDAALATQVLRRTGVAVVRAGDAADWGRLVETAGTVQTECAILSGGDTAQAVLLRRGVASLQVLGEPWSGMPLARTRGQEQWVLLKSGAFGDADALRRAVLWLRGEEA